MSCLCTRLAKEKRSPEEFKGDVMVSLSLSSSSSFFGTMVRRSEATLRMIPISLCVSFGWHFDECLVVISMQPGRNWCCNPNNGLFYCHTVEIVRRFTGNSQWWIRQVSGFRECSVEGHNTYVVKFLIFRFPHLFFLGTNLTSLACIIRIVKWDMYKAERYLYVRICSPLNFNVILFNTFCPEWTCRVGNFFQFFLFYYFISAIYLCVKEDESSWGEGV
jgi:hypothetical protein